jgi:hypothetical protein
MRTLSTLESKIEAAKHLSACCLNNNFLLAWQPSSQTNNNNNNVGDLHILYHQ